MLEAGLFGAGIDQWEKARRPHRTALEPPRKDSRFGRAGMELLGEREEAAAIVPGRARQHHRKAGHEKRWSETHPSIGVVVRGGAEICEPVFEVPVDGGGEVPIAGETGSVDVEDTKAGSDDLCEGAQGFEITGLAPAQPGEGFLAHARAGSPSCVGQAESARFAGESAEELV